MDKLYKINNFASINCEEDNKEDTALQLSITLHTEDDMLMYMITSYCYGVKSYLESKRITQEEADKLLSEAGLSEISYEIVYDLKSKIGGYYTDSALKERYNSLVDTEYFDICLEIFKRIKNEINNAKQQVNKLTKEEFEKLAGIELIEENGKLVYYCNLNLSYRKDITELPDNLKVLGFLDICSSGITQLPKGLEVEGMLDISETDIEELPEDTKFGDGLYINHMNKPFSFPKVLKVGDYFECSDTTIKRMPEELYVRGTCDFSKSTFDKLPEVMEVGYSLYLNDTAITELPKGLKKVYGNLEIINTRISKLNNNMVITSFLDIDKTQIEELPKGLIVNNMLYLRDTNLKDYSILHKVCSGFVVTEEKYNEMKDTLAEHSKRSYEGNIFITFEPNHKGAYLFENEDGVYIKADYILGKLIDQKGNVYHIQIGSSEVNSYLVTDGEGHWSHGKTLEEAKDDLLYKISKRNKGDYKGLTLDSELSFEDAITCYRVITGACLFGTMDFIDNRLGENKKGKYTINEIIELTEGEYGNDIFNDFFCKD